MYEVIGYTGSVIVAVSLMMSNILKLRWVNFVGAFIFAIYALLIKAYPVFALNAFISVVDLYYLYRMYKQTDYFELLEVDVKSDSYVKKFADFYKNDIAKYFPVFSLDEMSKPEGFLILRNMKPAGLFIYTRLEDGIVEIKLDYVTPEYRDLEAAEYVFNNERERFLKEGVNTFMVKTDVKSHGEYLVKMGFQETGKDAGEYHKPV